MKKTLIVLFALFIAVSVTNAQKINLSVGGELAMPMGTFGDAAGIGFGGTVRGEYPINDQIVGIADVGYLMWGGETIDLGGLGEITTDYSAIPIQVGAKYYFDKGFYGLAQVGLHMFTFDATSKITFLGTPTESSSSVSESKFGVGVGAGYELPLGGGALDINVKYQLVSDELSYLGARVAYKFSL
jgi:hypothetical protein